MADFMKISAWCLNVAVLLEAHRPWGMGLKSTCLI
jgi:hypothetical protein